MKQIDILADKGMELSQEERQLLEKLKIERGDDFFSNEFILEDGEEFNVKAISNRLLSSMYKEDYDINSFNSMFSTLDLKKEEKIILVEMYMKTYINKNIRITGNFSEENTKEIFGHLSKSLRKRRKKLKKFKKIKKTKNKEKFLEGLSKKYFTSDFISTIVKETKDEPELVKIVLEKGSKLIFRDNRTFCSILLSIREKPDLLEILIKKEDGLISSNEEAFSFAFYSSKNNPELLKIVLKKGDQLISTNSEAFTSAIRSSQNNPELLKIILEKGTTLVSSNEKTFFSVFFKVENYPNLLRLLIEKATPLISTNEEIFTIILDTVANDIELLKVVLEKGTPLISTNEKIFDSILMRYGKNNPELLKIILEKGDQLISTNSGAFSSALEYCKDDPELLKIVLEKGEQLISTNSEAFSSALRHTRENIELLKIILEKGDQLISTNDKAFSSALRHAKYDTELLKIVLKKGEELVFTDDEAFSSALKISIDSPELLKIILKKGEELMFTNDEAFAKTLETSKKNPDLLETIFKKGEQLTFTNSRPFYSALIILKDNSNHLETIIENGSNLISNDEYSFEKALEYTNPYPTLRKTVFELGKHHLIKKDTEEYINPKQYNEFKDKYFKLIEKNIQIGREGRIISLGNEYESLKQCFKDENSWQEFIKEILIKDTKNISQSVNDIYDYYNENSYSYPNIKTELKKGLKHYGTEELISSLGNQITNYSTTFKLIVKELENRLGNENIFEYIDNNDNLNQTTKEFSIGQIIIGLSARGEVGKLLTYIGTYSNKDKIGVVIKNILDYKKSNTFSRESYIGLLLGIEELLKKDNSGFISTIIENYFNEESTDINFKKSLIVIFDIKNNTNLLRKYLGENYKEYNLYQEILGIKEASILNPKLFEEGTRKDFVYIYGGNTSGGGIEFYERDIDIYLNKYEGYNITGPKDMKKENIADSSYIILEKDGISVTFINYEKNNKLNKIITEEDIKPLGISYRGHNSDTRSMIKSSKKFLDDNKDAFTIDGGCNNSSHIEIYRSHGVENQLITYDSTGRGAVTIKLMQIIIKYMRENEGKDTNITWQNFNEKIIGKREEEESIYAHENIRYPGNIIDILLKLENENKKTE